MNQPSPVTVANAISAVNFTAAFYIKLGEKGRWEADSIDTGKLRLGWRYQSIDDINAARWDVIKKQLQDANLGQGKPTGTATADFNALRLIADSSPDDVWITFYKAKLWWTRLAAGPVEQDSASKFRRTAQPWNDKDVNGRLLAINELPGKISRTQGFRATACKVKAPEVLNRILNGTKSDLAKAISDQTASLSANLARAIKELHWNDFETFVDLIFRHAGWIRVSVVGKLEKGYDLEVQEPITRARCAVQVKSEAGRADLDNFIEQFPPKDFRRIFFVVHSPKSDLLSVTSVPEYVEMMPPERLGELAMEAGLVSWLMNKTW